MPIRQQGHGEILCQQPSACSYGSATQGLDLRRTMTDARQWLVEVEDDADRVAELDALTARNTDGTRW